MADESARDIALGNEILRGVVGSTAHGTAMAGSEDRDELGVFIEPPVNVCGLESCDHYVKRDRPEGVRSRPGDVELTLYSLRRFCRLAARGNPTALLLLWLPSYVKTTEAGEALVRLRDAFVSRDAGERFLGYLVGQKQRLTGERGQNVRRPELLAEFGYDTKFAMHALRLGYEGIGLMATGCLPVPVPTPDLEVLRAARAGEISYTDVLGLIANVEAGLRKLVAECSRTADLAAINAFMVETHLRHWRATQRIA
jgi:hypothetical protein